MSIDAFWVAAGLCSALVVGLSKTGVPGSGILAVPLMAMVFPAKLSVGALLPMLIVADIFAIIYYRRDAQWNRLWGLFPAVAAGIVIGAMTLSKIDNIQLRSMLGYLVLALLLLEAARKRIGLEKVPEQWWFTALMGILAGFSTIVGNAAGPIMSIYLISKGLPKNEFMGTRAWYFSIVNVCKVPVLGNLDMITAETLRFSLLMIPVISVGAIIGKNLLIKIPEKFFSLMVMILAGISALYLILA